jgi:CheY-like chemotaxis protein
VRVLWVENHDVFVRVAGQFLAGHAVVVVRSLTAAREALAAQPFDAVLLDHDLEDGKGPSLVGFIRALPRPPAVIAVSAHEEGNRALLQAGADAVCGKMHFAQVDAVLSGVLASRCSGGNAPESC